MTTPRKLCTYLAAALGLTLLTAALRIAALLSSFDAIGYFSAGPLPTLLYCLVALAVAGSLSVFWLFRGDTLTPPLAPRETPLFSLVGSAMALFAFAFALIATVTGIGKLEAPTAVSVITVLLLAAGIFYFAAPLFGARFPREATVLCGYGAILATVFLLIVTYFDRYTQMNAPHKVGLHMALVCAALYLLYEVRELLQKPLPRLSLLFSALGLFFCGVVGISDTVAYLLGIFTDPLYLPADLLCLSLFLYIGVRAAERLLSLSKHESEEETATPAE